ncbi:hypothetical protein CPB85DRAFT_767226 [Mucidula mucida]|nr:hypothetical protein CPB85DRAFT_767226 [Mucidula mucida]
MAGKQLGKLRQWAGEVISSRDKTTVTEEFQELEQDIERRKVGAQRLLAASQQYHHVLSKKKALDESDKLLPVDTLGVIMIIHGEEFGEDSAFGGSLVKLGRAHCKIATLQEAYALTFQDTYTASLEQFINEVKEYEQQRKRLESRRLSYDAALAKQEKLKNSKKDKDRKEADEEADRAQARFEEASEDVRAYMHAIQENEIDQLRELTNFLDIEVNFVKQYLEVLQETQAEWSSASEVVPRKAEGPMHSRSPKVPSRSPKSPKLPARSPSGPKRSNSTRSTPSSSKSEISLDSSDDEQGPITPSRRLSSSTHKRSDSAGTAKTHSRPSSRASRHRSDSTTITGEDKSIRKNVTGWMDSVRGKKPKFASLQDNDADTAEKDAGTSSMTTRFGSLKLNSSKSKSSDTKDRILPPPSLQQKKIVRALYDFSGSSDELSFKVGDEILVLNEVLDEWWMGKLDGKQGLFPTSYTEPASKPPVILKRTRTGKTLEEDVYSAPVDSDDSPDEGYRTSDLEEEDALKSRPLAPSRSPFFGGPPEHPFLAMATQMLVYPGLPHRLQLCDDHLRPTSRQRRLHRHRHRDAVEHPHQPPRSLQDRPCQQHHRHRPVSFRLSIKSRRLFRREAALVMMLRPLIVSLTSPL